MTYTKVNISKPGDNMGVGGNKKDKIILFDFDDVQTWPARDANGIVIDGDIVFKEGAYMITLYATQHTIKANPKSEGDPDNKGVMQSLSFDHPGDEQAILEFRTNWMNKNIGAIVQRCSTNRQNLYGNPCAPLQMKYEATDDKDKNSTTFTLETAQKGPDVAIYNGTITYDTVTATVDADETDIDLTNGSGRYQLTDGSSAAATIATMSNATDGLNFTLIGSGGTYPSTITGGSFLLKSGASWTALAGAEITFRVFKDGASSYKAYELSRK